MLKNSKVKERIYNIRDNEYVLERSIIDGDSKVMYCRLSNDSFCYSSLSYEETCEGSDEQEKEWRIDPVDKAIDPLTHFEILEYGLLNVLDEMVGTYINLLSELTNVELSEPENQTMNIANNNPPESQALKRDIYLLYACDEWKSYESMRLIMASTNIDNIKDAICNEIREGNMAFESEDYGPEEQLWFFYDSTTLEEIDNRLIYGSVTAVGDGERC